MTANPQYPILTGLWQNVLQPLGGIAVGATALGLLGTWLIARRRIRVEQMEEEE